MLGLRQLAVCGLAGLIAWVPANVSAKRKIFLYTFSDTIPHPGICLLAEAASATGSTLRVIGLSKRPGYILIFSHSPTLKFLMLQEVLEYELQVGRIAADDVVIFIDGHDVMLQRSLRDILERYERWPGSPYLISGEKNCWPWPHSHPSHGEWDPGMSLDPNKSWFVHPWLEIRPQDFCRLVPHGGPYRYPNIGSSMGPVHRMLEVLRRNNRIVLDEDVNDQGAMWLVIFRHALELNIVIDQNASIFMNMLQYKRGELEQEPCSSSWFSKGRPPRNALTNSTPALLHFNGPSHEDDTWVNCYHTMEKEFRATGRGHGFFDVDHAIMVSTDQICDYSWYKIRNFHAHPMNERSIAFLEGLYKLPVDPGFLAHRGKTSAVDAARLGREEELHAHSPLLHKAMHGE